MLPVEAGGPSWRPTLDYFVWDDDQIDAEVVLGFGKFFVNDLKGVNGRHDHRLRTDQPRLLEQRDLDIRVTRPLPSRAPSRFTATLPQTTMSTGRISSTPIFGAILAAFSRNAASDGGTVRLPGRGHRTEGCRQA